MSEQGRHRDQAVHGTIRRRLLVNAVVDPDEVTWTRATTPAMARAGAPA